MGRFAAAWLAAGLLLAAPAARAQEPVLTGVFAGGYGPPGDFHFTHVEVTAKAGGGFDGSLSRPWDKVGKDDIPAITAEGDRIRFTVDGAAYDLRRTGIGYAGTVIPAGGRPQAMSLVLRPGSSRPEALARYEGTYDLGHGRTLSLSRNTSPALWWVELPSGETGFAYNLSDEAFVTGHCIYCVEPLRWRIDMVADGLRITEHGQTRLAPRLHDIGEQTVAFASADGTRLEGSVYMPAGKGPHPGLVLVHGSGAQPRNGFYGQMRFLAEAYARAGIAVLAYDKRGVGGSAGDWETAGLDLLAQDAAAAVETLRKQPGVDPRRVGLSGSSQAGWIIPLALRHLDGIALMQIRSGSSPMGVEESEWRRLVLQMHGEGFSQAEIDRALVIRHRMDDFTKTGRDWEGLEAAFKPVANEIWADSFLGGLPARDAPDWPWLREAFTYDTGPDFAKYKGPIQVLYGEQDFVPTAQALPMLEQALGAHRNDPGVFIAVWPGANHNYYAARNPGDREFPGVSRHVAGFYPCVTGWAAEAFGLRPKGSATRTCPKPAR